MNISEKGSTNDLLHQILSKTEFAFFKDWIDGDISTYNPIYARTLKHRVRRKYQSARRLVNLFESNNLRKINKGGLYLPKITLNKEELALARERVRERLPRRVSRALRTNAMENLPRMELYPKYFSEEVQKLKKEKQIYHEMGNERLRGCQKCRRKFDYPKVRYCPYCGWDSKPFIDGMKRKYKRKE